MAEMHLPRPVTESGEFLAAIHGRLGEQNELLAQILDRLPEPSRAQEEAPDVVELREPETKPAPSEPLSEPEAKPAAKKARKPRSKPAE